MSSRRSRHDRRGSSNAASLLVKMFTWSGRPLTVRDLVDRKAISVPGIVRVSKAYVEHGSSKPRFSFVSGSVYLVRDVQRHHLVVARTEDRSSYVTFARNSPLTFHLVSNDNALSGGTLTLCDILGGADNEDEGPCNGQRIQLSADSAASARRLLPPEVIGTKLELVDIFCERYLVAHIFDGATLNPELKIIPGYLPVTVDVARGMTTGTTDDMNDYIRNLLSVAESPHDCCDATAYEDVNVFGEAPHNHYEWIEPPRPSLQLQQQSSSDSHHSSIASSPPSVKFSTGSVSLTSSPVLPHRLGSDGRPSFDDPRKRPLPPIPPPPPSTTIASTAPHLERRNSADPATGSSRGGKRKSTRTEDAVDGYDSPYEDFDEILDAQVAAARSRWTTLPASQPMQRSGSVPFLLDISFDDQPIRRSSSHSMENLAVEPDSPTAELAPDDATFVDGDDAPATLPRVSRASTKIAANGRSTVASRSDSSTSPGGTKKYRPPVAAKPPPEIIAETFRAHGHSMLQRQRPVVRFRRGGGVAGRTQSAASTAAAWKLSTVSKQMPLTVTNRMYDLGGRRVRRASPPPTGSSPAKLPHPLLAGRRSEGNLRTGSYDFPPPRPLFAAAASEAAAATKPNHFDAAEDIYEQISSPLYITMTKRPSLASAGGEDGGKMTDAPDDAHRTSGASVDDLAFREATSPLYDVVPSTGSRSTGNLRSSSAHQEASTMSSGVKKRLTYATVDKSNGRRTAEATTTTTTTTTTTAAGKSVNVDEDDYCVPTIYQIYQNTPDERGQGVGAEKVDERDSAQHLVFASSIPPSIQTTSDVDRSATEHASPPPTTTTTMSVKLSMAAAGRLASLDDVPSDVTSLTVEDVVDCLRLLNLQKYVDVFRREQIDGALLTSLDEQLLVHDFEFKRFDAIKLEKFARAGWRPKYAQNHSEC